jgi:signal transduction histidine kinase
MLRSDSNSFAPEELTDIYNDIYLSALRLHRTQRNYLLLLDLKNVSPENLMGALSPRQAAESIEAGVREASRLYKRKNDLTLRVSPCSIAIKPTDLSRLVEELLDNAFKFSRQGTPVTLELDTKGQLTISDEGRGMTAEEIEHIGAFRQFDRQKSAQQGLGLGLVLVQKIADLYHAEFELESRFGRGTIARVALPVEKSSEMAALNELQRN